MRLEPDMLTLAEEPRPLLPSLTETEGSGFEGHEFFEASSIRKIGGRYYLVYSSVQSHELCYAVSERPDRDYRYGGTLVDIGDVFLDGRSEADALNPLGNTHGGIECCGGQWYVFYHRQTNRTMFSRQACAERIFIAPDGSIAQAPVTSCGLNAAPLVGSGLYPAAICCRLTGKKGAVLSLPQTMEMNYPYITQDQEDTEPTAETIARDALCPVQHVANLQDGAVAGYKCFDFAAIRGIRLELRGSWHGTILVGTDPEGESAETINVELESGEWSTVTAALRLPDGVYPLYFRFSGRGRLDFRSFTLLS